MKCRNCGKDISVNSVYCTYCKTPDPFASPKGAGKRRDGSAKMRPTGSTVRTDYVRSTGNETYAPDAEQSMDQQPMDSQAANRRPVARQVSDRRTDERRMEERRTNERQTQERRTRNSQGAGQGGGSSKKKHSKKKKRSGRGMFLFLILSILILLIAIGMLLILHVNGTLDLNELLRGGNPQAVTSSGQPGDQGQAADSTGTEASTAKTPETQSTSHPISTEQTKLQEDSEAEQTEASRTQEMEESTEAAATRSSSAKEAAVPESEYEAFLYNLYQAFERKDYAAVAVMDDSELAEEIVSQMTTSGFSYLPGHTDNGMGAGIHRMEREDGTQKMLYGFYYGEYENSERSGTGSLFWTQSGSYDFYFLLENAEWENDTLNGYYEWKNYIIVQGEYVEADFTGTLKDGLENGVITCTFEWNGTEESVHWESKEGIRGESDGRALETDPNALYGIRTTFLETGNPNTIFQ